MRKLTLEKLKELQAKMMSEYGDELPGLLYRISIGDTDATDKYNQKFVDLLNEFFTGETCSK